MFSIEEKVLDVLLISIGSMAAIAVEAASQAYREGIGVTVIDPRWVKPLPQSLITMARRYKSVVVLEDGIRHAGIASSISEIFREAGLQVAIHSIGVPLEFIEHAKRAEILEDFTNLQLRRFHATLSSGVLLWKRCNSRRMKTLTANRLANSFAI
jgi:deoxyxylulose-5-phosphate synthase